MKKAIGIFTCIVLLITVTLGVAGGISIYKADRLEIRNAHNIAGAVISQYPETEGAVVAALTDENFSYEAEGGAILAHYGYDSDMKMKEQYKNLIYVYGGVMALLFIFVLAMGYGVFFYTAKRQQRKEKQLIAVLEGCISGDFSFAENDIGFEDGEDSAFYDSLSKLAQSLKLKTAELDEERDSTKTLVTDISHQLKTPISAMKVCFDMYLEAESDDEKQEFLSRSMIQMDKLESLAAALINISRLENNMISLKQEKVYLKNLLIDAVNAEYHNAAAKDIDIEVEEFEDLELFMDKKWTVEALANIIDNGIKYSPEKSGISIRVTKLFSFVRIEFEDRGIGVPREERNRIFSRFFRGDSDAVKEQEGSGIGLYLTRKILEDQGGTVSVKPAGKRGSIFVVQIPL